MNKGKDEGVEELISYFDQPGICPSWDGQEGGWVRLAHPNHVRELEAITSEIALCRKDFSRWARNYLWIRTKEREKIPFRLNESQELILDKIYSIKARGEAQRIIILKARQLGCSTLIEGLITWRTVLFPNTIAVIVSADVDHSQYLFRMLQFFVDNLPWWMRPMVLSRKIEEGLVFDNVSHKDRSDRPGLSSEISVQAATKTTGVGQGRTIQAAHLSEIGDYSDQEGKDIVEGDLGHALAQNSETFAAIESTAKGTGNYFHRLWRQSVQLAEMANWTPIFLPWFFEKNRRISISNSFWKPDYHEVEMRGRISKEWVRCENKLCGQFRETIQSGIDITDTRCPTCGLGVFHPYVLTDQQIFWMEKERRNAEKDADSLKAMKAEICSTAEEAFQLSGMQVFPSKCLEWVNLHLEEPRIRGFLDRSGQLHGISTKPQVVEDSGGRRIFRCVCAGCDVDHTQQELPLLIWREPEPGVKYVMGVDVSEGLGEDSDHSVAFVNRIGNMREPDEQVALYRSNNITPVEFAFPCNALGRWYNEALMSIEVNKYDTTFSYVRQNYSYPNLYRWKHVDSTNMNSTKWGWETNQKSKPRLWQTGTYWLSNKFWIIHSKNFYQEMTTFQKESNEDRGAKAEKGFYDDEILAGLIALYCSHDADWDENLGMIPIRRSQTGDPQAYAWKVICSKCNEERGVLTPEGHMQCLNCGSLFVRAEKNMTIDMGHQNLWEELESEPPAPDAEPVYELM